MASFSDHPRSLSLSAAVAGLALFIWTSSSSFSSASSFPSLAFASTHSIPGLRLDSQHWILFLLLNLVIGGLAVSSRFTQRHMPERETLASSFIQQKRPKKKTLDETLGNGPPEGETLYETLGNGLLEGGILYNGLPEGGTLDGALDNSLLEGGILYNGLPEGEILDNDLPEGGVIYNGLPEGKTLDEDLDNGLLEEEEEETLDNGVDLQILEAVNQYSLALSPGSVNRNLPGEEETLVKRPEEEINIDEMEQEGYFDFEEETEDTESEHNHNHSHSHGHSNENEVWHASPPAIARLGRSKSEATEVFAKRRRERKRERRIQLGKWKTFDARFGRREKGDGDHDGDGEVDKKADAFIVRFHQQIELQRLQASLPN